METRKPVVTVTIKDLIRQTFTVGGHGGGGKDTSNSGVRLIHPPSGARGEGRENRSNTLNTRSAFRKLVATPEFQKWIRAEHSRRLGNLPPESPEEIMERINKQFDRDLQNGNILVEEF